MVGPRVIIGSLALAVVLAACGGGDSGRTAAPALRYSVFLAQMLIAQDAVEGTVRSLMEAGSGVAPAMSTADVQQSAASLAEAAATQRTWLAENPPAACYEAAHAQAGVVTASLDDVATALAELAEAQTTDGGSGAAEAFANVAAVGQSALGDAQDLQAALDAVTCLD